MSYRGMGQTVVATVAGAASPNWAGIERFARHAAGGAGEGIVAVFSATARANRQNRFTASLRALADSIAVREQAQYWLGQPASRHREGLIYIADWARRQARAAASRGDANALMASYRTPPTHGTLVGGLIPMTPPQHGTLIPMTPPARGTVSTRANAAAMATAAARSTADAEAFLRRVRAELQKPREQWHRDLVQIVSAVEAAKASPEATIAMLKSLLSSITGDARLVLAVQIVGIEQVLAMMQAMQQSAAAPVTVTASPSDGTITQSAPQPTAVGNYTR